ncbi:MAG: PrgI family protein [Ruminiclostridium sp.]|nr:PrgI family protein [Ruminiclostridium sp.]
MIKADVPQDVTEYKEQFFFGMTSRQLVSVALMLILAVVTFLIGRNFVTSDILVYLIILEVAPLAAVGFLKYNGMGFEKIAVKVMEFYFGSQRRKMEYLPPETEIHDKVRSIYISELESERRGEIKEQKKKSKAEAKAAKKKIKERSDKNARK